MLAPLDTPMQTRIDGTCKSLETKQTTPVCNETPEPG
jgi:hypothetical protein